MDIFVRIKWLINKKNTKHTWLFFGVQEKTTRVS
jgi:hypothetical protein